MPDEPEVQGQRYDQLYAVTPTPVVALNRAIAVAEVDDPASGLATNAAERAYLRSRRDELQRVAPR